MKKKAILLTFLVTSIMLIAGLSVAQETTGGLQGTVKDSSGAVVRDAKVEATASTLEGSKTATTDSNGYYRFANLPPGTYTVTVMAPGFRTVKREGLDISAGRLPTVDISLQVGINEQVVNVSAEAPLIDTTTRTTQTTISTDVVENVPHGLSYQSVIQFAPMARNEPLAGYTVNGSGRGGSGGSLPGSSGNGNTYGFSVGGGADSENSYLVEGQDTEQLSGGYSKANVPFQFIDEVQLKTSGIQAEFGGALGGVANVIMKKGSNAYHGSFFSTYSSDGLSANNNNAFLRYSPTGKGTATQDRPFQIYSPSKDHFKTVQPGFTVGGPIVRDRLWFFLGLAPEFDSVAKTVDFSASTNPQNLGAGKQYFTQDKQSYYTTARLDAAVTSKIRLNGSWLYQYGRETGAALPISDPVSAESVFLNRSINAPLSNFSHGLGWSAPNSTYNVGADITLTPQIVSTTRFGYFFENYHDFGWQTSTPDLSWVQDSTAGTDNLGNPLPAGDLQQKGGFATAAYTGQFTPFNANKHYQLDQDVAFFKSGWLGTHNIKVGYQLNHLVNVISQNGNVPFADVTIGNGVGYSAGTQFGTANCATLTAKYGTCAGQYGYLTVTDFATVLTSPASDWNHALFAQDSWTIGRGLTLDLGVRVEKETLPAPGGVNVPSIDFGWTDKIAPRLGFAWDPTHHGKMKVFGSYGVVNDVMKLLLAQTSWGAQAFEQCSYPIGPGFSIASTDLIFKQGRACPSGAANVGANFASGKVPTGLSDTATGVSLIENVNFRPAEPVSPGVKPYRQHEIVGGFDYQIANNLAFEARYDRRRLDHVIEDASLADPALNELYTIVNPGEGVNKTIDGYASYLKSLGEAFLVPGYSFDAAGTFGTCPSCPALPKAIRNYDAVELRVMGTGHRLSGMFAYTYSRLWGNYAGLTNTDQTDGNAQGRNSPDTSRAFDEPFYYFGADGKSNNGLLATDRPNTFKGYAYYTLPWKHMATSFGIFQYAYQGTPLGSYIDLASATQGQPLESTYIFGRDKWVPATTDASGNITFGTPFVRRTPWYTQTDFNVGHTFKLTERDSLRFDATATNLFNQHVVVGYYQGIDSTNAATPLFPGLVNGAPVDITQGAALYKATMTGYNPQTWVNGNGGQVPAVVKSSLYGQPQQYQLTRNLRLGVSFSF